MPRPASTRRHRLTREAVLEFFRMRGPISTHEARRIDSSVEWAAKSCFGSWAGAIRAAGFDYHLSRKWWPARVLEKIRERARRKLSLRHADLARDDPSLAAGAYYHCGGWREAVEAAGFHVPPTLKWTPEAIIAEFRRFGRAILSSEVAWPFRRAVYRRFGNWANGLRAAGYDPADRPKPGRKGWRWSPAIVIAATRARARHVSTMGQLHRDTAWMFAMVRYFGGWRQAFKAAGLDPSRIRRERRRCRKKSG